MIGWLHGLVDAWMEGWRDRKQPVPNVALVALEQAYECEMYTYTYIGRQTDRQMDGWINRPIKWTIDV